MFNFTYRSEKSDGQFNGRFAFRAPYSAPRITPTELRALANAAPDALADPALRHEFLHWKVFKCSRIGRALVGKRYRVRAQFLRGNNGSVERYYLQRSSYFCAAYPIHEQIVEELEAKMSNTASIGALLEMELSSSQQQQVEAADELALSICKGYQTPYIFWERKIDGALGAIATREFGVQAYVDLGQPTLSLNEVSLKGLTHGIFNAATETAYSNAPGYIKLIRKLVRYGNAERWFGKLTQERLASWAYLKLKTEVALLTEPRFEAVLQQQFGTTREYVRENVDFITSYTGASYDNLARALITELLLGCASSNAPTSEIIEQLERLDSEFLYFFYAHGN